MQQKRAILWTDYLRGNICLFTFWSLTKTLVTTQVNDSGGRILQESAGKCGESYRILQQNTANSWNMESIFPPGIFRIFPMISGRFLQESTGSCRNPSEKIRKIPGRNTASNFLVFSVASRSFPAVRRSSGKC